MSSSRLTPNAFVAGLILSATVLMAQGTAAPPPPELPSFARLDDKVAHDQIASAAAAVRYWSFEPSTLAGRPVKVYYVLTVNFP